MKTESDRPQLSIIVPIFNDFELANHFCSEVVSTFEKYFQTYSLLGLVEIIFVDDGSLEDNFDAFSRLKLDYPFIRAILFSRNFGQHIAISCGYEHAEGQYVGMMNVDLQEKTDEIPKYLDRLKKGDCDIVYGMRRERSGAISEKISSWVFYLVFNFLTGYKTPRNVGTMRFMTSECVSRFRMLSERSRHLPGLEQWLGFRPAYVEIEHHEREEGVSSYTFYRRLKMAIETVIGFSDFPLKLITLVGLATAGAGFISVVSLAVARFTMLETLPGYLTTISTIILLSGVQIVVVGVSALYIGRIVVEAQGRPVWVIRKIVDN